MSRRAWWTSTSTSSPAPASAASYAGDNSLYPDGFSSRVGVTTVADAGCSGWRNFEEFKERIIDRSKTRVLAFLNIVGNGMRGAKFENNLADMEAGAGRRDGEEAPRPDRGHQDGALCRTGMDAGGTCRGGRHHGRHSGDGGFRRRTIRSGRSPICSPRNCGRATSIRTAIPACAMNWTTRAR